MNFDHWLDMSKPAKCPMKLDEVDLFAYGAQEHWYPAYEILHRDAPVLRIPGEGFEPGTDGFVLSKYEDIARVVRDPIRYKPTVSVLVDDMIARGVDPEREPRVNAMIASFVTLRPTVELWRTHRQELTDPWVGPGATRHTEMITRFADQLIDQWIDRGEVDFVHEFARPLPQMVMATVLGFPHADIQKLADWGTAQVALYVWGKGHRNELTDEQAKEQFTHLDGFKEYVAQHVREKRRNPQEDMVSWLTQTTYSGLGRKLTDLEINGIVYAMILGGLETTQYALEEQAQLLCEHPEAWQLLKQDRKHLRSFTEEALRLRSPTQGLSTRMTTQDEVFQGVHVPKGSQLHLRWAAANVDPSEWECPMQLKLDRKAVTRHLAFSAGPRVCPGAGLSRTEQFIAWSRLLDRLESIEYAPDVEIKHQPGIMLGTLNLKLRVRKAAVA
jgi:cytochrome P450